jgi:hypothetical protein
MASAARLTSTSHRIGGSARPPPLQSYPGELQRVSDALAQTRAPGWLRFDAILRDYADEARSKLARLLTSLAISLKEYDQRWFVFVGECPLLIWLHRNGTPLKREALIRQAEVVALTTKASKVDALCVGVTSTGDFAAAHGISVPAPSPSRGDYRELMRECESLRVLGTGSAASGTKTPVPPTKKPRPNERCWCESGRKYKKCHGSLPRPK